MERRRPRRPAPHPRPLSQPRADRAAPWNAGVLAGLRRTAGPSASLLRPCRPMERRRPRRPAPQPRPLGQSHAVSAGPMERRRPRRPAPHPRPLRQSHADRAAPWNAGVLAGLRRTLGPLASLMPSAPPHGAPASSPACAAASVPWTVSCRQRRPMERRRPRRPAPHRRPLRQSRAGSATPWNAGVHAGLRRSLGPLASLMPSAPPHGAPASSPACAAPSAPQAVSCRPRRPMERRRPRRPAPHPRSLGQSHAVSAAPWSAGVLAGLRRSLGPLDSLMPSAPRTDGPSAGEATGAPGGWWPVRTPALQKGADAPVRVGLPGGAVPVGERDPEAAAGLGDDGGEHGEVLVGEVVHRDGPVHPGQRSLVGAEAHEKIQHPVPG